MGTYTLTIACPDRLGIVAAVSGFLASHNGTIITASQHSNPMTDWFFNNKYDLQ